MYVSHADAGSGDGCCCRGRRLWFGARAVCLYKGKGPRIIWHARCGDPVAVLRALDSSSANRPRRRTLVEPKLRTMSCDCPDTMVHSPIASAVLSSNSAKQNRYHAEQWIFSSRCGSTAGSAASSLHPDCRPGHPGPREFLECVVRPAEQTALSCRSPQYIGAWAAYWCCVM